jgi:hypothetical protein
VSEHALHSLLVVFEEGYLLGTGFLVRRSAEVDIESRAIVTLKLPVNKRKKYSEHTLRMALWARNFFSPKQTVTSENESS